MIAGTTLTHAEYRSHGWERFPVAKPALPDYLSEPDDQQTAIPLLAKTPADCALVENWVQRLPTAHRILLGDSRQMLKTIETPIQLAVTSPPYWNLKQYPRSAGQLGNMDDYEAFLDALDHVWRGVYKHLVPGGRLVIVVGDVLLSRRQAGRHWVVPLHASIQERCRRLGFDNLAPVIWYKIGNAAHEVENGNSGFLGKPYEPNAVIKNDIEYILMQRKGEGYRKPTFAERVGSVIPAPLHQQWFRQVWELPGASTRNHPAPFPESLAERLIRMFSFVGDTVLDPFMGSGTVAISAAKWGRNSIGIEVDPDYNAASVARLQAHSFRQMTPVTVSLK
jgi:DNA modification methylase